MVLRTLLTLFVLSLPTILHGEESSDVLATELRQKHVWLQNMAEILDELEKQAVNNPDLAAEIAKIRQTIVTTIAEGAPFIGEKK